MAAVYRDGRAAALARSPWDSNPHDGTTGSATERVLSIAWRRGYTSQTRALPADLSASRFD